MVEMMFKKDDLRYTYFVGPQDEMEKIEKHFNPTPSYMFMPSFKGVPKPEVFLNKFRANGITVYYCHSGLWKTIVDWCNTKNIEVRPAKNMDLDYLKYTGFDMSFEEWCEYVNSWEITLNPYEYQLKAAWLILKYRQSLSQLATRAGKTLIAYMVFRYMLEHDGHNILMIVPNTLLVKQAVGDFDDYKEYFMHETVWAGGERVEGSNLTVGTFQSLVKMADKRSSKYNPKFFEKFDVVLVDEAHTLKCESINCILNQPFMKSVKLKFGFSGSLPDEHTIDSFCCHALMGPTIQDIRSKELMDGGYITPIEITQINIRHEVNQSLRDLYIKCGEYLNGNTVEETYINEQGRPDKRNRLLPVEEREFTIREVKELPVVLRDLKGTASAEDYVNTLIDMCKAKGSSLLMLEQMIIHRSQKRIDIIKELLDGMQKNCVVFAHHTEYLNHLYKYFKAIYPDRPIYLITGSTNDKKREKIKQQLLTDKAAVLFASYGCVGTGLTLKNIDYGIFAQSFKSHIINKQALGRGLCLANDKDKYRLYDLIDVLPTGRLKAQGEAKMKLYKSEKFEVHTINK